MNRPPDPYRNFRFRVSLGNINIAGFSEVTLPNSTTEAVPYREGTDDPNLTRQLSGLTTYGDLTLHKGVTTSMELYKWKLSVDQQGAGKARKNVSIVLVDEEGKDKAEWTVTNAWPKNYETSGLTANANDVFIETLTFAHEGIERKK